MKKCIAAGVICIISFVTGFILGGKILVNMINDYKRRMERNLSNMMLFNNWLELIYSGGRIEQYFYDHGYKRIMIYGNGYIGKRLYQALSHTDIEVAAIMDKSILTGKNELEIGVDSKIPDVDCIVVTPIYYFDEIFAMLREKTEIPIISMEFVNAN